MIAGVGEGRMFELFLDDFVKLVFSGRLVCLKAPEKTKLLGFLVLRSMTGLPEKCKQALCKRQRFFLALVSEGSRQKNIEKEVGIRGPHVRQDGPKWRQNGGQECQDEPRYAPRGAKEALKSNILASC